MKCLRGIALLVFPLLLVYPLATTAGPASDDFLIVPGDRIGLVSLDEFSETVRSKIFDAHHVLPDWQKRGTVETMGWPTIGLYATFLNGYVLQVVTRSPRYRTKEGVRVGMSYRDARKQLGKPDSYEEYPTGDVVT